MTEHHTRVPTTARLQAPCGATLRQSPTRLLCVVMCVVWGALPLCAQDSSGVGTARPAPAPVDKANFIPLAGNLAHNIDASDKPYVVTADLYVPSGKTVVVEPGVVLLFRAFTTLHVEGRLVAAGTRAQPIVFSSENDRDYNPGSSLLPNPYDWNGITVHEGGIGAEFTFCRLQYSVYGIDALTKFVKVHQTSLRNNGRGNLSIAGAPVNPTVTDGDRYSYALPMKDAVKDGVPIRILQDPAARKRTLLRFCGLGAVVAGTSLATIFGATLSRDTRELDALSDAAFVDENSNIAANTDADWRAAASKRRADVVVLVGGLLIAAGGGVGLVWSFTF